jgi:hypothetical protein
MLLVFSTVIVGSTLCALARCERPKHTMQLCVCLVRACDAGGRVEFTHSPPTVQDNGGPTAAAEPGPPKKQFEQASNYPLRMGKATNFEGGVRGIGWVAGGANSGLKTTGGYENTAMIHVTDWLPTLCEVAGCKGFESGGGADGKPVVLANGKAVDGVSAWAAISRNGSSTRTEILHDTIETRFSPAMRVGDYKLVGPRTNAAERAAERAADPDFELVYTLYNIATDPEENHDLAASMPDKVAELKARIAYHNKTAIAPCDRLTPDRNSNPMNFGNVWTPWSNDTRPGCPQTGVAVDRDTLQD